MVCVNFSLWTPILLSEGYWSVSFFARYRTCRAATRSPTTALQAKENSRRIQRVGHRAFASHAIDEPIRANVEAYMASEEVVDRRHGMEEYVMDEVLDLHRGLVDEMVMGRRHCSSSADSVGNKHRFYLVNVEQMHAPEGMMSMKADMGGYRSSVEEDALDAYTRIRIVKSS